MAHDSSPSRFAAPLRSLFSLLWRSPLYAIPFALFFGTLFGKGPGDFVDAYWLSLVFSYSINLCFWLLEWLILPHVSRFAGQGPSGSVFTSIAYTLMSLVGSLAAALILHFTIVPGFLGNAQRVAIVLMFALVFGVLGVSISLAIVFYKRTVDRVKAEEELNLARRIQRSFLLTEFPHLPRFEVHAMNLSSRQVSGDFYDVVAAEGGGHLLAIADVSGKGVPAALLTSMLQASLRTQALNVHSVAQILANLNHLACRSATMGQFATFFLARVETEGLRMTFTNAGHNWPVVYRTGGEREFLVRGGVVVGILEDATFEQETIELRSGDRLVFYTDGVTEAQRADQEMFGEERLYALIQGLAPDLPASEVNERILAGVHEFLGPTEPNDDITLMTLRVLEPAGS